MLWKQSVWNYCRHFLHFAENNKNKLILDLPFHLFSYLLIKIFSFFKNNYENLKTLLALFNVLRKIAKMETGNLGSEFKQIGNNDNSYYVDGTNRFSRFFIKLFHRPSHEIVAQIFDSKSSNLANFHLSKTKITTPEEPHYIRIRKHFRASKNRDLFEKLKNLDIKTNQKFNLETIASQLGVKFNLKEHETSRKIFLKTDKFIQEIFIEKEITQTEKEGKIINFIHDLQKNPIDDKILFENFELLLTKYPNNQKLREICKFLHQNAEIKQDSNKLSSSFFKKFLEHLESLEGIKNEETMPNKISTLEFTKKT